MRKIKKEINHNIMMSLKVVAILSVVLSIVAALFGSSLYSILNLVVVSGIYCFCMSFGNGLISYALEQKYDWINHTKERMIWGAVISSLYIIIATLLIDLGLIAHFDNGGFDVLFSANHIIKNILVILVSTGITIFFYAKYFMKYWKISVIKYEEMKKENIASQYEALKSQIDPHFFFNSLNVVSSLIDEDKVLAQRFINELSSTYRYILQQKDNELSSVSEEIKFVEKYVFLQKIRFENAVSLNINLNDEILKHETISLALQIIFENIFKHNAVSEDTPIVIDVFEEGNFLVIRNNLNKKKTELVSNNIGIENIKARYSFFSDVKIVVEKNDKQFVIKLPLLRSK
jgi:hypothetical protein